MKVREGYYSEQIRNEALLATDLGKRQKEVLHIIELFGPISSERIALHLNVYPHQITPRVLELRELGFVEFAGEEISMRSHKKASLWRVKEDGKQMNFDF